MSSFLRRLQQITFHATVIIALTACGGGGGSAPADTTAPVITLNGTNPVTLEQGDSYAEAGATATDNVDTNGVITLRNLVFGNDCSTDE